MPSRFVLFAYSVLALCMAAPFLVPPGESHPSGEPRPEIARPGLQSKRTERRRGLNKIPTSQPLAREGSIMYQRIGATRDLNVLEAY